MIIGLFLCPTFVQADYQVTVGQIFTYTVNDCYMSMVLGSDSDSTTSFNIGLATAPEGTSFTIEVTDVVADFEVFANITIDSTVYPLHYLLLLQDLYATKLFYIVELGVVYNGPWPTQGLLHGAPLPAHHIFDVANDTTMDFFRSWADSTYITSVLPTTNYAITTVDGHFDESSTIAVFDWIIDGSIDSPSGETYPFDVVGYELFKCAFYKSTGVMQGYRIDLEYKGTNDGRNWEVIFQQEVTIDGYTLPDFYFSNPGGPLPGFGWFISIFAFSSIVITSVILRKKKNN